jgi:NAD(P)-dependent dehydrogenase (short-subunit alcohol dehydrogenase family)
MTRCVSLEHEEVPMNMGAISSAARAFVVTGGNTGIGKATALGLARQGQRVVIVSRDPARGERAVADIRGAAGNPDVTCLTGDLGSVATTHRLAEALLERVPGCVRTARPGS